MISHNFKPRNGSWSYSRTQNNWINLHEKNNVIPSSLLYLPVRWEKFLTQTWNRVGNGMMSQRTMNNVKVLGFLWEILAHQNLLSPHRKNVFHTNKCNQFWVKYLQVQKMKYTQCWHHHLPLSTSSCHTSVVCFARL